MRATTKFLTHLVRQRTDVRAGRTLDHKSCDAAISLLEFVLVNFDFDSFQLNNLFFARQFIGRAPLHFLRGKRRRHLLESPGALRRKFLQRRNIQRRRGVRPLRLAIGIVRIRREPEPEARLIPLAAPGIELHQPRRSAKQQHKNTGGQRIERAQVPDLPEARQMTHRINNVVRRLSFRLIDDERAVVRRRLWLSWHS